ncbi:MAG: endonuclease [Clostridia bacterium]|nr:endonuclease [Clostridia bacterium]
MKKIIKGILKAVLAIIIIVVVAAGGLIGFLSVKEFKPADTEEIAVEGTGSGEVSDEVTVLSWNIGYAGLGKWSDFFMDGGENTRSADKTMVNAYLSGINTVIAEQNADIVMLQEVDSDSTRTFGINEVEKLAVGASAYALNYSCPFVPFPWPPIGKVNSGLLTFTDYPIISASRISLPCPFSWPIRVANLKRCLLISRIPAKNDRELVIVNLHLEAYDSGEGKIAQTKALKDFIEAEYANGNYVIAGGDFNQEFPGVLEIYPNTHEEWMPGTLENDMLPDGWSFVYDTDTPTCRLLNQPYNPADTEGTQYYVIDGFIVSPNVLSAQATTIDAGFENSDHNPVRLEVKLG